jgi:zinc protease
MMSLTVLKRLYSLLSPTLLTVCLTLVASCSPQDAQRSTLPIEGYSLVENYQPAPNGTGIAYEKYVLDNGLTVLIHEDNSDPLIHVDVTYHVGSAREEPQRSGFAHFFEHMMFQGSEHVGDDQHFKIVSEAGGTMNGSTNNDRTNYFETVPSNQLETMLWLESDRMGFLLNSVTQEKFEVQRGTVKNERGQNVENQPYGKFNEVMHAALYPPEHPYSWPVIGYPEDLDAATLEDLKAFFLRWYGPNNATLSIGGNVKSEEAIQLALKYFGDIPKGPEVEPTTYSSPVMEADRYVSYEDGNIRFPALIMTWPTVPLSHPDQTALDALVSILGEGRKSTLYKNFVLTQRAIQSSGFNNAMELGGTFSLFVLPFPGVSLTEFEKDMRQLLDNFSLEDISEEDLQIFKATSEAGLLNSLASVRGKVSRLAFYETFLDDPAHLDEELNALQSLSREDILRVFQTYIKGKPAVIQSVVSPANPEARTQPDNFTIPTRLSRNTSLDEGLELRETVSSFNRSEKPIAGPSALVIMPSYKEQDLPGNIRMISTSDSEVPLINLQLVFQGGRLAQSPEQYGLAALAGAMMNEGTTNYSAEEFEKELDKLGSSVSVTAGGETFVVSMQTLERNLEATMALLEERLLRTTFEEPDLERLRQQQIESLQADMQQPNAIASTTWQKILYGQNHVLATPFAGTVELVEGYELDEVKSFARASLHRENLRVVLVGAIEPDIIAKKLEFLQQLPETGTQWQSQPAPPQVPGGNLYFVNKSGAAQSEIRIGYLTNLTYDPLGEYFERSLMNYVLGGAFNSRINMNLREDKAYTYGARSGFSGSELTGPFTASASVLREATADSIQQFVNEIQSYRDNGITDEELQFTKNAIGQSEALDYETPGQKAGLLSQIITYGLPRNFVEQQQTLINGLTKERVDTLAKQHLPLEDMIILVVGDKESVYASLEPLGYPIEELSNQQ